MTKEYPHFIITSEIQFNYEGMRVMRITNKSSKRNSLWNHLKIFIS